MTEEKKKLETEKKPEETKTAAEKPEKKEEKKAEEKKDDKKPKVPEKPKKTEAIVNAYDVPISTKHSAAICRFIKKKKITEAISDLERVVRTQKAVPMKGEIPHRRGKGMMSGRYPKKAAREFLKLLKSLSANSNFHNIEDPVIIQAIANIGERPFGRHGIRRKRTHVKITAKSSQGGKK